MQQVFDGQLRCLKQLDKIAVDPVKLYTYTHIDINLRFHIRNCIIISDTFFFNITKCNVFQYLLQTYNIPLDEQTNTRDQTTKSDLRRIYIF